MLASLSSFIRKAVTSHSQSESASSFWYMASSFTTHEEFLSFCSLICPRHSAASDELINDIKWSKSIRHSNIEDFIGAFDYAWGSRINNEFSLGELGEVGQAVGMLRRDVSSFSQSNSTTSRMAVSVNSSNNPHKLTSPPYSV